MVSLSVHCPTQPHLSALLRLVRFHVLEQYHRISVQMVMVETNVVQSRFKFNENIGFKVSLERLADIELIGMHII